MQGFALWFLNYSTWEGVHGIYLEDLYVRPAARGAGYGKALLRTLARTAVSRGYARVEWRVLNWNEPSIRFYEQPGRRPAGRVDQLPAHRPCPGRVRRRCDRCPGDRCTGAGAAAHPPHAGMGRPTTGSRFRWTMRDPAGHDRGLRAGSRLRWARSRRGPGHALAAVPAGRARRTRQPPGGLLVGWLKEATRHVPGAAAGPARHGPVHPGEPADPAAGGGAAEQADYLTHFRADAIVAGCRADPAAAGGRAVDRLRTELRRILRPDLPLASPRRGCTRC